MTQTRDMLERAPEVSGTGSEELARLMGEQNDYLQSIYMELRKQNADVLCTARVKGTSQLNNTIVDDQSHEVVFMVGGKPVEVYHIQMYSSYQSPVAVSIHSLSNPNDGVILDNGDVYDLVIPVHSVYVQSYNAIDPGTPLIVNGPAHVSFGGLFLYAFTIPDYDRVRNAIRY